jgi:metal-dependent amidase/aminoacylase/carboxypeptidase family protein
VGAVPLDLSPDTAELTPGLIALRRELHRHPELASEEVWTAVTLAGRMRALGVRTARDLRSPGVRAAARPSAG